MAMIGRNAAVAEVGKHRHQVDGPLAFAAWLGVHAMLLSGVHSKTDAFLNWAWDYFDRDHAATVEAVLDAPAHRLGRRRRGPPHIDLDDRTAPRHARPRHRPEETPWPTTTTSSSSAPEPAAAPWRTGWPRPASAS